MIRIMLVLLAMALACAARADVDRPTKFSNQGSVANTRHNLTQRAASGTSPSGSVMTTYRNDYGEVCVYCHTPHGASPVQLPLWNRTMETRTYTLYGGTSGTLSQTPTSPGINSLACLSCHDGQTAIDSIINMPGAGRYKASQATSVDTTFLSTWVNASATTFVHANMVECMTCHSSTAGIVGAGATSFEAAMLGTDLSNDHPIGVTYPVDNPDYKQPGGVRASLRWFDNNGNGRPDTDEIRLYNSGSGGYEVECSSCHDPHGVPSAGAGSVFNRTFLRASNAASGLCQSCHSK